MSWLRKPRRQPLPHAVPRAASDASAQDTASHAQAEARLRRLEWTTLKTLDGQLLGDWRSFWRGSGLDLADLREYQPQDDVRHIDWNTTARLQTPHVRVLTEDREMAAWFVLDLSASVDFGSGQRRKRQVLAEFVAVMARLLTRRGNRVGALLCGQGVPQALPPRAGRRQVLRLMQAIDNYPSASPTKSSSPLGDWLLAAGRALQRRATVFVVSDFISAPGWQAPLGRLAQRHDLIAVHLYDPLERALPDLGLITLCDAETGEHLLVDTHAPGFRQRFAQLAEANQQALERDLARAGVDTLALSTADDMARALLHFAGLRRQRARLAAGAVQGWPRPGSAPASTPPSTPVASTAA